ncbi:Protein aurora borealis [Trichinella spiralis]|uniref:Protein aurora borealis n=1 Tax=Trichinella spiralis TaxID=6334 RepID=A0ABR3KQD6_TRISP
MAIRQVALSGEWWRQIRFAAPPPGIFTASSLRVLLFVQGGTVFSFLDYIYIQQASSVAVHVLGMFQQLASPITFPASRRDAFRLPMFIIDMLAANKQQSQHREQTIWHNE